MNKVFESIVIPEKEKLGQDPTGWYNWCNHGKAYWYSWPKKERRQWNDKDKLMACEECEENKKKRMKSVLHAEESTEVEAPLPVVPVKRKRGRPRKDGK